MGPQTLSQVLRHLPTTTPNPNLMVGPGTSDDAAVYKINENQALISTLDFFAPMVDDPYVYGQIAAANSLSDVYAMGGKPLLALNIVCFPDCLPTSVLEEMLRGGADKAIEAGCIIAGGHTVRDDEPKYGLAVTGMAHPDEIISNAGAQAGDLLLLTKPLGTGIINTGIKAGLVSPEAMQIAVLAMSTLNKAASEAMLKHGASACTDITGFGLLGHAAEMAEASEVSLHIKCKSVPLLPEAMEMARMGLIPAGAYDNRQYLEGKILFDGDLKPEEQLALYDPQTSGGLLISVPEAKAAALVDELKGKGVDCAVIGQVQPYTGTLITVV